MLPASSSCDAENEHAAAFDQADSQNENGKVDFKENSLTTTEEEENEGEKEEEGE